MEHLALEIFNLKGQGGAQFATLAPDTAITITETSEVFAKGDLWSFQFSLNVRANSQIFGTTVDLHGSRLHEQLHRRHARLWADGLPLFLGYLTLGDEAEVDADGNVDVGLEAGQHTFDELIDGGKANQVPLLGEIRIGVALWRKRQVTSHLAIVAQAVMKNGSRSAPFRVLTADNKDVIHFTSDSDLNPAQEYPRMVYPTGTFRAEAGGTYRPEGCINTDEPYAEDADGTPTHPYCNVALCYQKYGYETRMQDDSTKTDYSAAPVAQRGYEYMPPNRVNSAPCFYVLYWLRCLFNHLGIHIDENQMLEVEDLRRLFFVNTKCAYRVPKKPLSNEGGIAWYRFEDGKRLLAEHYDPRTITKPDECHLKATNIRYVDISASEVESIGLTVTGVCTSDDPDDRQYGTYLPDNRQEYMNNNRLLHDAFATSECFPDADISETIKAIETGFGVRFLFNDNYKRVRIVLLRNLFRDQTVQQISCDIVDEDVKVENNIRGFRMTYGESEDTHFYYKGFADLLPHKEELWKDDSANQDYTDDHDYSKWDLNADYSRIIKKVSAFDTTCYVTPNTGNAYGIKVDKNAKRYDELHPSLFGFADFMDAEDGDCTGYYTGDDNTIETVEVGFMPAIMNDLNMEEERKGSTEQRFALFVDEAMRPRRVDLEDGQDYNRPDAYYDVDKLYGEESPARHMTYGEGIVAPGEFSIASDMYATATGLRAAFMHGLLDLFGATFDIEGCINEGYRLYLQDNYEPNDTGVSPIETHDWGLTLGIMRGSGGDARIGYSVDPDDQEGNETWDRVAGSSISAHPDACDNYGRPWDYNGQQSGTGGGERLSLKLRAEKPNPYFDPKQPESDSNRRYLEITNKDLRQRGLCDQFYKEYSYWIRNARIVKRTVRMTLAQLLTIDKTKRVRVGDVTGFIRKMKYTVSNETGLGNVVMEIMYI